MEVVHPTDPTLDALLGWDRLLGYFVEVRIRGHRRYEYSDLVLDEGQTSLQGQLNLLAGQGFFTAYEVAEAHRLLVVVDDINDIDNPGVLTAARVIAAVKEAAAR